MKHNLDVFSRVIAAVIGGYALSVAFSFAFAQLLVWGQICELNEAVMSASMLSYVVYFIVIIACFCRKSAWLLWRDILLSLCLFGVIYYVLVVKW
ncbi:hypothetical protein [uncultured Psychrosphaera sp.]|uniref:hypothetical protein n=1 Tax=uncultured Psychrosphaera sp. TaxID=1403522 RepID=UPI00262A734A|nr:hypothetical protein [uncultured Psychrosphaera sp.]